MKFSVLLTFTLVFSMVITGFIPQVLATISIDFDLDQLSGFPGLDMLRRLPGPQGPQCEQGPAGTPAENKDLSIWTVEGNVARNGACVEGCASVEKSVASSSDDEVLTGGRFKHTGNANYGMDFSRPNSNSWKAHGYPMSQDPSYTQAYAQCQKLTSSS